MKKKNQKYLNTHPYSIKKLSTKTNTQKSLFLNILRCNHLPTKIKDTKHYYFLIHRTLLFFNIFFFLRFTWTGLNIHDFKGGPSYKVRGPKSFFFTKN